MHKAIFLLWLFVLLDSNDCDPQKQAEKIRSLEADVKQLKADVTELKQKPPDHHYELRTEGFRTFRFDPATGDTCIQLTNPADWKRKETKGQSCDCSDKTQRYVELPSGTDQQQKRAENFYNFIVKPACGD
jgi:hypothetical protein